MRILPHDGALPVQDGRIRLCCQESGSNRCCSVSPSWSQNVPLPVPSLTALCPPQPSTTSCPRGRWRARATRTSLRPPTWFPSRWSPPRARPVGAPAARTTETSPLTSAFVSPQRRPARRTDGQTEALTGRGTLPLGLCRYEGGEQ